MTSCEQSEKEVSMKKRNIGFIALFVVMTLLLGSCATAPQTGSDRDSPAAAQKVKNVIFLLTDGTGPEAWAAIRWVKGAPLAVDTILTGAVRTYGADSIITDSAPGATAYATGHKGSDKGISVGAWNVTIDAARSDLTDKYVPLATLLEGAKLTGRAVGLIATSNVQHATPAAFSSHWQDRNNYNELGEQQVYQGMDVVLSGGSQYLVPKEVSGGKRIDGENLVDVLKANGYTYVTTRDELTSVSSGRVWGAFAPDAMAFERDRARLAPREPSLSEMTAKAIELLSAGEKGKDRGFFLFVEGSKVDWAAHANDPAGEVYDLLAFDDAVRVALDFAKRDGNTLVIVVADHGTGGISVGTKEDKNYSQTDDDSLVVPMRKVKLTGEGIEKVLAGDSSEPRIRTVIAEECGIEDLSAAELKAIQDAAAAKGAMSGVVGPILSKRARIGWTTGGHTGVDVFLFAYGPGRPTGLVQNTEVGRHVAAALGFNFDDLNARLFVEAAAGFSAAGFETSLDRTDPANPVLVVQKGSARATLPLSKNLLIMNGKTIPLEGIVVLAEKLDKVYLPRQAIDLVTAGLK
jgi:alkaline phosphatase